MGRWSLTGVFMDVGDDDGGGSYQFYGLELAYRAATPLGEGNYRVLLDGSSRDFYDPRNVNKRSKLTVLFSFDQELGEIFGAWLRFGEQKDDAAVTYKRLMSGGIDINGRLWHREQDNIGLGYAYLDGGNLEIAHTNVAEAYIRFVLNRYLALTLDLQYMQDKYHQDPSPEGFIYGLRLVSTFE